MPACYELRFARYRKGRSGEGVRDRGGRAGRQHPVRSVGLLRDTDRGRSRVRVRGNGSGWG